MATDAGIAAAAARDRLTGGLALALGVAVALAAALGPLGWDVIVYHVSEGARAQVMGGDAAGAALVAPVSVAAGLLARRGHRGAIPLALGPAGYAAYTAFQLAVGGDVTRYPGNSERFLPLFLAIVVLAGLVLARGWAGLAVTVRDAPPPRIDRILARFALGAAAFLALALHLPGLADAWTDAPRSAEYLADPQLFWLVKAMDLGIVVPILVAFGVASLRGRAWASRGRYAVAGWMATLGTAVASMAVVMVVTDQPGASVPLAVGFVVIAAAATWLAVAVLRPLFARSPR